MMLQSIVVLCIALGARFWAIKTVPIVQLFYPVYQITKEPTWKRSLLCPHYVGSMALFVTAFLWQPSTTGIYPLVVYPLLLAVSSYYQQNCHDIHTALKRGLKTKDITDKNV
jgi:4-hydroxybenzoate polyprenyltransferase